MIPTQINQVEKGLDRVIDALSDKENFTKLLSIFSQQVQEIEDQNLELSQQKNITVASGVWLDYIGKIIGEDRSGRDDEVYRKALVFRIGINTADGTPDNIINLVKTHTQANNVLLREYGKASFVVSTTGSESLDSTLYNLVQDIKPAGVSTTTVSNLEGKNFVPAWLTPSPKTRPANLKVNSGGVLSDLKLSSGDTLSVSIQDTYPSPFDIYHNDTTYSYLNWIKQSSLKVNSGGVLSDLKLSSGDTLSLVTSPKGLSSGINLAQVITRETTSLN